VLNSTDRFTKRAGSVKVLVILGFFLLELKCHVLTPHGIGPCTEAVSSTMDVYINRQSHSFRIKPRGNESGCTGPCDEKVETVKLRFRNITRELEMELIEVAIVGLLWLWASRAMRERTVS
jgi:hypothetical protein